MKIEPIVKGSGTAISMDVTDWSPGMCFAGRYILSEAIEVTPHHRLWRARQSYPIERDVLIKVQTERAGSVEANDAFYRELNAYRLSQHSAIACLYETGDLEEGYPFLVVEYIRGEPLADYCEKRCLALEDRIELFCRACQPIEYLHQQGVIVNGLCMACFVVAEDVGERIVKLATLGAANAERSALHQETPHVCQCEKGDPGLALGGNLCGCVDCNADVDIRDDVLALGGILYELITGVPPQSIGHAFRSHGRRGDATQENDEPASGKSKFFRSVDAEYLASGVEIGSRNRWCNGVPDELAAIVAKALSLNREQRYSSVGTFLDDIARWRKGYPVEAYEAGNFYHAKKFIRRHRYEILSLGLMFLAVFFGSVGLLFGMLKTEQANREVDKLLEVTREKARFAEEQLRRMQRAEERRRNADDEILASLRISVDESVTQLLSSQGMLSNESHDYLTGVARRWNAFAETVQEDSHRTAILAEGDLRLASIWSRLGEVERAAKASELAIQRWRSVQNSRVLSPFEVVYFAKSLGGYAAFLHSRGDLAGARQLYRECQKLTLERSDSSSKKGGSMEGAGVALELEQIIATIELGSLDMKESKAGEARLHLRSAVDRSKALEVSDDKKLAQAQAIVRGCGALAIILMHANKSDEALASAHEAKAWLTMQYGEDPESMEVRRLLGELLGGLAEIYLQSGRISEGKEAVLESRRLIGDWLKKYPGDVFAQAAWAKVANYHGAIHLMGGGLELAKEEFLEGIKTINGILSGRADDLKSLSLLADLQTNLAICYANQQNIDKARELFESTIKTRRTIAEIAGDNLQWFAWMNAKGNYGVFLHRSGDSDEAIKQIVETREVLRDLVQKDPENGEFANYLAELNINLGGIYTAQHRLESASECWVIAERILSELLGSGRRNLRIRINWCQARVNVLASELSRGEISQAAEDLDRLCQEATDVYQQSGQAFARNVVIDIHNLLAVLLGIQGRTEESKNHQFAAEELSGRAKIASLGIVRSEMLCQQKCWGSALHELVLLELRGTRFSEEEMQRGERVFRALILNGVLGRSSGDNKKLELAM